MKPEERFLCDVADNDYVASGIPMFWHSAYFMTICMRSLGEDKPAYVTKTSKVNQSLVFQSVTYFLHAG